MVSRQALDDNLIEGVYSDCRNWYDITHTTASQDRLAPTKKGRFFVPMKGFGIYVKNNLLEPKHIDAMGEAVWLYMWCLDKMTSVNENGIGKVLGGKPVNHAMVAEDLGIEERRYQRWIKRLRDAGYIDTLRTPYGQVIIVNKAEKPFKKRYDKNVATKKLNRGRDTTKMSQPDTSNLSAPPTKMADQSDKNVRSNKDNTVDNTKTSITNVIAEPVRYGKPEINKLFDYWAETVGYNVESKVTANRRAASNLLKKYGPERLSRLIEGVGMAQSDPYAPRIADFCDLQSKTTQLVAWGKKKHGENEHQQPVRFGRK